MKIDTLIIRIIDRAGNILRRFLPAWLLDNWQFFGFLRAPLKTRMIKGLGLMMLPLLLLGSASLYTVHSLDRTFRSITDEILIEREALIDVQFHVIQFSMVVHQLRSSDEPDLKMLVGLARGIDHNFRKIDPEAFGHPEERAMIDAARSAWSGVMQEVGHLHRYGLQPYEIASILGTIPHHLNIINDALERASALIREEIAEDIEAFSETRHNMLIGILVLFGFALLIVGGTGILLSGSILVPMDRLQQAAQTIAAGDYATRLEITKDDELGRLMGTFNDMAAEIEQTHLKLVELATHDTLTGLLNRRELLRTMDRELERGRRYGRRMGMLVLDLDHFKKVNDSFGHSVGDRVLVHFAGLLRQSTRQVDHIFRYGGEEFVILLPESSSEQATLLAERLCSTIAQTPIPLEGYRSVTVTVSIGVATFPAEATDGDALFAAADSALYRAKESGRNRVCTAPDEGVGAPLPLV